MPVLDPTLRQLTDGLLEREEAVRISFLAGLAQQHVLLLGPPGTAKSLVARRVAAGLGGRCFTYLLTRFSTPDELFGPLSLRALQEEDQWRRNTQGYLPDAEVAFLDEIFKASSAILNSLLGLLGERRYSNGARSEPSPLQTVIAASNELAGDESLAAFADRFLVRLRVLPLQDEAHVAELLRGPAPETGPATGPEGRNGALPAPGEGPADLVAEIRAAALRVRTPPWAIDVMIKLRRRFPLSDRRWRQSAELLRTAAAAHGVEELRPIDLLILRHVLWEEPDEAAEAEASLAIQLADVGRLFDLDPSPLHASWQALLLRLVREPGVASPLADGLRIEAGKLRIDLSASEAERWRSRPGSDPEAQFSRLRHTGLWWDGRRLVSVRRGPEREIYLQNGLSVTDPDTFFGELPFNPPARSDEVVTTTTRREPGARLRPSLARWLNRDLYALSDEVHSLWHLVGETRASEEVLSRNHLFVPEAAARPLLAGLDALLAELHHLQARIQLLAEHAQNDEIYVTVEVDVGA